MSEEQIGAAAQASVDAAAQAACDWLAWYLRQPTNVELYLAAPQPEPEWAGRYRRHLANMYKQFVLTMPKAAVKGPGDDVPEDVEDYQDPVDDEYCDDL